MFESNNEKAWNEAITYDTKCEATATNPSYIDAYWRVKDVTFTTESWSLHFTEIVYFAIDTWFK